MSVKKEEVIVLRISSENKKTIKTASDIHGKSLTSFIIEAALKSASDAKKKKPKKATRKKVNGGHDGVPSYFRALCVEAQHGGENGYANIGYTFSKAIGGEMPYDIDFDDWDSEVKTLNERLKAKDESGTWAWFAQHYPAAMQLIPARRREQFLKGVERAFEEDWIRVS